MEDYKKQSGTIVFWCAYLGANESRTSARIHQPYWYVPISQLFCLLHKIPTHIVDRSLSVSTTASQCVDDCKRMHKLIVLRE